MAQAARLPDRLAGVPIHAIYASPLERTRETAAPLAAVRGLEVRPCEEAIELGFGDWTSRPVLVARNRDRGGSASTASAASRERPSGELMPEVQTRIVRAIERLRATHPGEAVLLVSHGDVIRAAMAYFLGVPLDLFQRIEIRPVSLSRLRLSDDGVLVLGVNDTGELYV